MEKVEASQRTGAHAASQGVERESEKDPQAGSDAHDWSSDTSRAAHDFEHGRNSVYALLLEAQAIAFLYQDDWIPKEEAIRRFEELLKKARCGKCGG